MAKYGVTYSCGHEGQVQLYGPQKERDRKLEWMARDGLCPECYKSHKRAEADARGPTVLVRYLCAYDPAAEAERCEAQAIRAEIKVEAMDDTPADRRECDWGTKRRLAAQKITDARCRAATARQQRPRSASIELVVIDSYAAKDLLRTRGYRFERDAVGTDFLGLHTAPGWVKSVADGPTAEQELAWCISQGWPVRGHAGPIERLSDALTLGRSDVLHGLEAADTVAAATAAREAARADRAAAREAAAARLADAQERESHAATFRVGTHAGAVRLVPPTERTEARPWDLRIEATDGRTAWGWASEDGWFAVAIERPDGAVLTLPAGCRESDRIGQDARQQYESEAAG